MRCLYSRLLDSKVKIAVIFLASISIALLNRWYISSLLTCPPIMLFMRWYFNDIVGACAFCAYCDLMSIVFVKTTMKYFRLILLILIAGLFWEYITPLFRMDTTSDYYDLFAYTLGANIYYLVGNTLLSLKDNRT